MELAARLQEWAEGQGFKWTHILLENGRSPSQPMLTFWGAGSLDEQRLQAAQICRHLQTLGVEIVRVKTEADLENSEVPVRDEDAAADQNLYFETHVKLRIASPTQLDALREFALTQGARLSRNARRTLDDGAHERFVTHRIHGVGRETAGRQAETLIKAITDAGYDIVEVEREYVVFDSNLTLDAGWF